MKKAGILMPVASLPERHGSGTFGPEAYRFVDLAEKAGMKIWQILPLNPLGFGNSPYQPYSSYAMDDLYISLDLLERDGLIGPSPARSRHAVKIDYEGSRAFREPYLREAFANFKEDADYAVFAKQPWVKQYAVFMTFKKDNGLRAWLEWPAKQKDYPLKGKEADLEEYRDEIRYQTFLQYILDKQWKALKKYANDRHIEIMGDIPFYVGLDSADVWSNRSSFLLDKDGHPRFIAGVPPDYFSATGQRWGNPIYDWEYLEKNDFSFWMERLTYTKKNFDIIRVDHFRAFDTYWKIPASCPTAMEGEWIEAPGYKLFDTLKKIDPDIQIVAEDLGDLRPEVLKLRDHYNFRGMRVIQFTYDDEGFAEKRSHLLVYTGTHDNDPLFSWYKSMKPAEQRKMRNRLKKLGYREHSWMNNIIRYSLNQDADMVIVPLSDFLHMGHKARLNTPGTVGAPNWMWRLPSYSEFEKKTDAIREEVIHSGR